MFSAASNYQFVRVFLDGMLCMMALYGLLIYALQRRSIYWQYSVYILFMVVNFHFIDQGYNDKAYAPGVNYWVEFFESLALIFYLQFIILLLEVKQLDPFGFRVLRLMIIVLIASIGIDTLLYTLGASDSFRSGFYITNRYMLCAGGMVVIPRIIRLRAPIASYFIIGASFFLIGCLFSLSANFLPELFTRDYSRPYTVPSFYFELSVVLEILCFTLGMSLRVRQSELEKIRYQEELVLQLQENERKRQRLQRIRDEIARDLHDGIGADLSAIAVMSRAAIRQIDKQPEQVADVLTTIAKTSRQIIESIREIVWSLNSNYDSLENLSFRMKEVAYGLFEDTNVQLHLNLPPADREGVFPADMRRDLFLVYKESLNNVARHADARNVWVNFSFVENALQLAIQDDGKGFDAANVQSGNGLYNLKQRVASINATLEIASKPGQGTSVKVKCPVAVKPYEIMNA